MAVHDPFEDPVLGRVTYHEGHKEWEFSVPIRDREVRGSVAPLDPGLPLREQGLDEVRACVAWIRDNEPAIREYITDQMFEGWLNGWYDEEIDTVTTREGFRDAILLHDFSVLEDHVASLYYNDGGLFGGHSIVLSVGAGGYFKHPPNIWG